MTFQSLYDKLKGGWEPRELSIVSARSFGKSVFQDLYMQLVQPPFTTTSAAPRYHGTTANTIVLDEIGSGTITADKLRPTTARSGEIHFDHEASFDGLRSLWAEFQPKRMPLMEEVGDKWIFLSDVKASFKDAEFPDADTYLVLEKLDKKDPRHPNPAAGTQKHWFVLQGHKRIQVKNRTQGEARAKAMHLQTIAGIKKRREQSELEAIIAVETARLVAAENDAKLKALPSFGGF
ncbi:hypothetical protein IB265_32985 [Ensifer sp. ENS10]|uniref:hypothetical protein n=1 Tax=Ensifer sp. ENS10 TaxID=2769286 RepID=UPI00177F47FB|nr:hypothetical protein [Ensifer sp. ENS10]MBD9511573.1 hypothetical protein [Ensifer sp. ENS10]